MHRKAEIKRNAKLVARNRISESLNCFFYQHVLGPLGILGGEDDPCEYPLLITKLRLKFLHSLPPWQTGPDQKDVFNKRQFKKQVKPFATWSLIPHPWMDTWISPTARGSTKKNIKGPKQFSQLAFSCPGLFQLTELLPLALQPN